MNDIRKIKHDLKRDVHNILSLLKFINKDEEIKDPDLKQMLEMAISKEELIIEGLNELSRRSEVTI